MFIIPIPPTIKDMDAIATRMEFIMLKIDVTVDNNSYCSTTENSSFSYLLSIVFSISALTFFMSTPALA